MFNKFPLPNFYVKSLGNCRTQVSQKLTCTHEIKQHFCKNIKYLRSFKKFVESDLGVCREVILAPQLNAEKLQHSVSLFVSGYSAHHVKFWIRFHASCKSHAVRKCEKSHNRSDVPSVLFREALLRQIFEVLFRDNFAVHDVDSKLQNGAFSRSQACAFPVHSNLLKNSTPKFFRSTTRKRSRHSRYSLVSTQIQTISFQDKPDQPNLAFWRKSCAQQSEQ